MTRGTLSFTQFKEFAAYLRFEVQILFDRKIFFDVNSALPTEKRRCVEANREKSLPRPFSAY